MAEERTFREYATPSTDDPHVVILYPAVEANNFKIKSLI